MRQSGLHPFFEKRFKWVKLPRSLRSFFVSGIGGRSEEFPDRVAAQPGDTRDLPDALALLLENSDFHTLFLSDHADPPGRLGYQEEWVKIQFPRWVIFTLPLTRR